MENEEITSAESEALESEALESDEPYVDVAAFETVKKKKPSCSVWMTDAGSLFVIKRAERK